MFFNQLLDVHIRNFCSIEELVLDVENQRLTHIIGINNDDDLSPSNGSGKSTIKSALCWNLFGMTETGRTADAILPWSGVKNCMVSSSWSINKNTDTNLTIIRYRAHREEKNALRLFLDGVDITGKDNDDTQSLINNYLGFNYDLFCLLLTTGMTSKKMKDFMVMTDKEKKEFVGYLLDLSFLDVGQEKAKEKAKAIESEKKDISEKLVAVNAKIEAATANLATYKSKVILHDKQITETIQQKEIEIAGREEEIPNKRQILEKIREQVKVIVIPPAPDTSKIDAKRKQIKLYRDHNEEQQKIKAKKNREVLLLTESLGKDIVIDDTNPAVAKAKSELVSAERELAVLESEKIDAENFNDKHLQKLRAALVTSTMILAAAETELESLQSKNVETVCPTCGQDLQEDHVAKIKLDIATAIGNLKDRIDSQRYLVEKDTGEIDLYTKTKVAELITKQNDRRSELEVEITQLRNIYEETKKAEYERFVKARNIDGIKNQIAAVNAEISTADAIIATNLKNINKLETEVSIEESDIRELQTKILDLTNQKNTLKAKFSSLKSEYENLKERLAAEKASLVKLNNEKINNPYQQFVNNTTSEIEAYEKEKSIITASIAEKNEELSYIQFWIDGFGDKGVKSYILDSITELLEQKANFALSNITNGNMSIGFCTQKKNKSSDTVKDEFTVEIYRDGQMIQFVDLSKGERCRVAFAVNYALKALGTYYHGLNLNFEWYDEVLDGLDEIGCYQVIQFLRRELATYESIFVVSHNENVKNLFDKNLIIEKTNGKSVLKA